MYRLATMHSVSHRETTLCWQQFGAVRSAKNRSKRIAF